MCCLGGGCFALCNAACSIVCSEQVKTAACNPTLCSSCLTGTSSPACTAVCNDGPCKGGGLPSCFFSGATAHPEIPTAGACGTSLCTCLIPPCIGVLPIPGNPCNTPCSPLTCGVTDAPPAPCQCGGNQSRSLCKSNAGGAGSAGSSKGGGSGSPKGLGGVQRPVQLTNPLTKLLNSLGKLGTGFGSLLGYHPPVRNAAGFYPGQPLTRGSAPPMTANTFLLVIVVVGVILLFMAFGRGREG